jgi:hypothetical protein
MEFVFCQENLIRGNQVSIFGATSVEVNLLDIPEHPNKHPFDRLSL